MIKRLYIITLIFVVLPVFSSCRAISSIFADDEIVAEVAGEKLYRSEVNEVIPAGVIPEDSARIAQQYVKVWVSDHIYLKAAQRHLSKKDRDVTEELEDYRKSLLKYRYEQLYVNEWLDTLVSDDEIGEYYDAHKEHLLLERPVVKARFVNIAKDSPMLPQIRQNMSSTIARDLIEVDNLASKSAVKYTTWGGQWVDITEVAKEYKMDYQQFLSSMNNGWVEKVDTTGYVRLTYVHEMLSKGKIAPKDFYKFKIKDIIISSRKQNLIKKLEQDLLKEAAEDGQYVIY